MMKSKMGRWAGHGPGRLRRNWQRLVVLETEHGANAQNQAIGDDGGPQWSAERAIAAYLCEVERNGSEIPTVVEEVGQKLAVEKARLVSAIGPPRSRSQDN